MRAPRLTPRDRRAVLIGAAVLVPGLLWSLVASPYLSAVADANERLAAERGLLRRELELLASASEYPKAFDAGAERLLKAAPRLMGGEDDGSASAAMAGYVRRLARMGGANLTRVEPAAAFDAGGGVRALPVAVTGETDLEGLLTFLQLIESGPKLVHVQELRLEAAGGPAPMAAYAAPTPFYTPGNAQPEVITFRFTATAFTLASSKGAAAADPAAVEGDSAGSGSTATEGTGSASTESAGSTEGADASELREAEGRAP